MSLVDMWGDHSITMVKKIITSLIIILSCTVAMAIVNDNMTLREIERWLDNNKPF